MDSVPADDDTPPVAPARPFRMGVGRPHPVLPDDLPRSRRRVDDEDDEHDGQVDEGDQDDGHPNVGTGPGTVL